MLLGFSGWLSASLASAVTGQSPFSGEKIYRYRLNNGATLIVKEDPSARVAALNVWVKAGSVDEAPEERGMAHLIEHMLFKGTPRRGVGEISRQVEAAGGYLNAFTSYEYTCFYVVLPADRLEEALDIQMDAYLDPTFDDAELRKEKEVVFEEMRMRRNDPWSWSWELLFKTAFRKAPYRFPVIGDQKVLKKVPRKNLLDYFKHRYVPQNTVITVAGDVDAEKVHEWFKRHYASKKALIPPKRKGALEPEPEALRLHMEEGDIQRAYVSLGFSTPPFLHADTPALEVLAAALGDGDSSRFSLEIREKTRSAEEVGAEFFAGEYGGLLVAQGVTPPDRVEAFLSDVAEQIRRVQEEGVSQEELEKIKTRMKAAKVFEKQSMDGQAKNLGRWELLGGIEKEAEYWLSFDAVSAQDVRRVARRYLQPHRAALVVYHPKGAVLPVKPSYYEKLLESRLPSEPLKPASEGALKQLPLPRGAKLIVKVRRGVPMVSLGAYFRGGFSEEGEEEQGLTALTVRALLKGTRKKDFPELAARWDALGAHWDTTLDKDFWGIVLETLSEKLPQGLDLTEEVLTQPAFAAREVEKEKKLQIAEKRRLQDDPAEFAQIQADVLAFAGTPYGHEVLGTEKTLFKFQASDVRAWYRKISDPSRLVWVAVGDFDPEFLQKRLSLIVKKLPEGKPYRPKSMEEKDVPSSKTWRMGKEQATLVMSLPAPPFPDRRYFVYRVLGALLNGMGARLFVELRDKRSLAYSVWSSHEALALSGAFQVFLGCAPEKIEEAREGILQVLRSLQKNPPGREEFQRAKNYIKGLYQVGLQSNGAQRSVLARFALAGPGAEGVERYPEEIDRVGEEELQAEVAKLLSGAPRWVQVEPTSGEGGRERRK